MVLYQKYVIYHVIIKNDFTNPDKIMLGNLTSISHSPLQMEKRYKEKTRKTYMPVEEYTEIYGLLYKHVN